MGSNPSCDTCVLERDTLLYFTIASLHPVGINGYLRGQSLIVCMKKPLERYGCPGCILPRELRTTKGMLLAQHIETVVVNRLYLELAIVTITLCLTCNRDKEHARCYISGGVSKEVSNFCLAD